MGLWLNAGTLVANGSGNLVTCDHCPSPCGSRVTVSCCVNSLPADISTTVTIIPFSGSNVVVSFTATYDAGNDWWTGSTPCGGGDTLTIRFWCVPTNAGWKWAVLINGVVVVNAATTGSSNLPVTSCSPFTAGGTVSADPFISCCGVGVSISQFGIAAVE